MVSQPPSPDILSIWASLGFSMIALLSIGLLALVFSSYVKIVTVLGIVRVGLGVESLPSAFVTGSLAIALSFFVMFSTIVDSSKAVDRVLQKSGPSVSDANRARALNAGLGVWKEFLSQHAGSEEKKRFRDIAVKLASRSEAETKASDTDKENLMNSWQILAPAFLVSELKEAFATGLSIFLPFLVIDLLVANILVAVGLKQVSPVLVSFPFKLLLFVLVDGWALITANLVSTYV